jgi:hypothetical protein
VNDRVDPDVPRPLRTVADLGHDELARLVKEHLLAGHLIDRAGMPQVIPHGLGAMRDVAIDEWMGASPIYTKRMQRLLGFEGETVETVFKGMQLDVGAPPEFMDFRYEVHDDHHGAFHLDHCGALMDVEPMGDEYVTAMCHDIEDPTFDATGWASNPRVRMRPVHRPPRVPADRHPHCEWTVTIDPEAEALPEPERATRLGASRAAQLPLAPIEGDDRAMSDGMADYSTALDPDLDPGAFSTATLRALVNEVCLQGHLLVMSFLSAVEDRFGTEAAVEAGTHQFCGVAGVAAERLRRAFGLGDRAADVATAFELHPAFHPRGYTGASVALDGDRVVVALDPDAPARLESGFESWVTLLADGHDTALSAIAAGVDPHWQARPDGRDRWVVERGDAPAPEPADVTLAKFSTGATFQFGT